MVPTNFLTGRSTFKLLPKKILAFYGALQNTNLTNTITSSNTDIKSIIGTLAKYSLGITIFILGVHKDINTCLAKRTYLKKIKFFSTYLRYIENQHGVPAEIIHPHHPKNYVKNNVENYQ